MTKLGSANRDSHPSIMWVVFAAVVVFVYLFGLTIPLVGPDEPRYAQVAREMFERGDWVTPTLGGYHWFEKPALLYWLQIAAYNLFGVSEFSARFGSALFGLGTILSLWILGRSLATESTKIKGAPSAANAFANWLALIAASSIGIIVFSRGASFDIILTFPMTAALVSFFIFDRSNKAASLFLFYFFIGLGLLAKGLVGIVFPFAIVGFYHLLSWRLPSRIFILSLVGGTVMAAAVAATWYLPMYQRHGWEFIDEFFIQHHFQRYTSNKYFHPQPFYFFFWVLPLMTIPWLPFFIGGVWQFVRCGFYNRETENTEHTKTDAPNPRVSASSRLTLSLTPLLLFSIAWLAVPLVFFSFSGSKLPGYILPAVPPALIIAAICVYSYVGTNKLRARLIAATALGTFVVIVALLIFVTPRFAETDSVKGLIAAADVSGLAGTKVLTLHTVSHNAEYYAAGRLVRDESGKQRKLLGPAHVVEEIRKNDDKPVLVLVPLEYLNQLLENPQLNSRVIKDNGELAIVYVEAR